MMFYRLLISYPIRYSFVTEVFKVHDQPSGSTISKADHFDLNYHIQPDVLLKDLSWSYRKRQTNVLHRIHYIRTKLILVQCNVYAVSIQLFNRYRESNIFVINSSKDASSDIWHIRT